MSLLFRNRTILRRFAVDRNGAAAVEFAFIAPLLLIMFLGVIEASDLLTANRRVSNTASALADLTTQSTVVYDDDVPILFDAARAVLSPYAGDRLSMVVTSVRWEEGENAPEVAWSEADGPGASPYSEGGSYDLPDGLIVEGSSVVAVEVDYAHESAFSKYVLGPMNLDSQFYLRPRRSLWISRCEDENDNNCD